MSIIQIALSSLYKPRPAYQGAVEIDSLDALDSCIAPLPGPYPSSSDTLPLAVLEKSAYIYLPCIPMVLIVVLEELIVFLQCAKTSF
jgi:hypothetical protein